MISPSPRRRTYPRWPRRLTLGALWLGVLCAATAPVVAGEPDGALAWLEGYLRINTSNPPGNEGQAADYLAEILHRHGHSTRRFVSPNGRTSLLARTTAKAARAKPLVLLHHMDVVPPGEGWTVPPFDPVTRAGVLYGRGAIDSKSLGIAHLAAFIELSRNPDALDRDLWFLATADEETGGIEGMGWLFERYPELVGSVGAVITEAGVNRVIRGQVAWWGLEVAQKRPLWLRVSAESRGGHGSGYHPSSATHILVRALDRVLAMEQSPHLSPAAYLFFRSLTPFHGSAFAALFDKSTLEEAQQAVAAAVEENRLHKSLLPGMSSHLLDTIQVTTITNDSSSVNVVPANASATLDIRLLPDTDEKAFMTELEQALGADIKVEVLLDAKESGPPELDGDVYQRLAGALRATGPVVPTFIAGTTDSRYFRERRIPAYGFSPFTLSGLQSRGIHSFDESIPVAEFEAGVARMVDVLRALTTPRS